MEAQFSKVRLVLLVVILVGPAEILHAQVDFHWHDQNGGNFDEPGNWSSFFPGSLPDIFVRTVFDLPQSYTVAFPRDERTNANSVRDGNVVFDLQGHTYTHGNLFVGEETNDIAELTLINGAVDAGPTTIGEADSTFGALIVGDSATFDANSVRVGHHGAGQLLVRNGGTVSTGLVLSGSDLTGSGTIEVTGVGAGNRSTLTISRAISVGLHNEGTLRVTGGALVESNPTSFDDPDEIGLFPAPGDGGGLGAVGQVFVDGTAADGTPSTWNSTGPLLMGNVAGSSYAQGFLTITGGGQVQHTEALLNSSTEAPNRVEISGTDAAGNPSQWSLTDGQLNLIGEINVTDGGKLDASRGVVIGWADNQVGHVTISGTNANGVRSSYTGGGMTVGGNGDGVLHVIDGGQLIAPGLTGSLTLAGQAASQGEMLISGKDALGNPSTVEFGRTLSVGFQGSATMTVADGGVLRTGFDDPISVGFVALRDTADAVEVAVTDPGSSWEHANSLFLGGGGTVAGGHATMTVDNLATVDIGGTLKVWNTSDLNVHGGTLTAGTLELAAGCNLRFGIGGTTPGDDFGQLLVDDDAFLDGNLQIDLLDGFEPSPDDAFVILDAFDLVSDTFVNVPPGGRVSTGDNSGSFRVDYGTSSPFDISQIVLSDFFIAADPGDYNDDGVVDAADYTVWRNNLGASVKLPNDTTPDIVDQADYAVWKSNFGAPGGSGTREAPSTTAVPEPSTWPLMLLGPAAWQQRRRI